MNEDSIYILIFCILTIFIFYQLAEAVLTPQYLNDQFVSSDSIQKFYRRFKDFWDEWWKVILTALTVAIPALLDALHAEHAFIVTVSVILVACASFYAVEVIWRPRGFKKNAILIRNSYEISRKNVILS